MTTRLLAVAACFLAVFLGGCTKEESPEQLIADAWQLQAKGDGKAAAILLRNVLQKDPDNIEASYLLGVVYVQAGEAAPAEIALRKALAGDFEPAQIVPHLARSLLLQRKFQQLLDETADSGESAELIGLRGRAQLALGRFSDARSSFQHAIKLQPDFPDALLGQAGLAAAEKDPKAALGFVEQALAAAPQNVEAWLLKGDLLRSQGADEQAIHVYGRALEIDPGNVIARVRRASMHLSSGKLTAAQPDIDAIKRIVPGSAHANYAQAMLDFHKGDYLAARISVEQVLRVEPDHMPSLLMAGVVHHALGALQQAEPRLKRFLDRYPDNLLARRLLASTQLKSQLGQGALETIQAGLKQAPGDRGLLILAGEAYMQLKQPAKATEYLLRAVAIEPKSPGLRTKLGMAHLAAGETERAIKELESAVELNLGQSQSHAETVLILTLLDAKEYDRALAAALKLQKNTSNPVALNLLGAAYLGKKDDANARKSFESALAREPGYLPAVMNLAQLDLAAKRYESARTRFQSILAKDRKSVPAMVGLSKLENALGNVKGAVSWLEKAYAENPSELEVGIFLANHYLKAGEPKKALALASDLRIKHPDHLDVLNVLGQAQFESGATTSALATYKNLAGKLPDSSTVHYRLASAEMATENYTAATASLNRALRLKPDYLEAQTALALLEFRAGKHLESIKLAQHLQKRHPKLAIGYSLEGDNLVAQRKFAAAEKSYEKAFNIAKSGTLAVKWHAASTAAGNSKQADARLNQWLKDNPNDLGSQLYLATHYVNSGFHKAAIEVYESVLRKDTKNVPALNNLASLYHREKDPRALSYFEQAYQLMPENAAIADNVGWLLLEQGKVARGVEILRKATNLAPQNRQIRYHLAVALAKSGDEAQAAEELEKLLAKGDKFAQREAAQALLKQLQR